MKTIRLGLAIKNIMLSFLVIGIVAVNTSCEDLTENETSYQTTNVHSQLSEQTTSEDSQLSEQITSENIESTEHKVDEDSLLKVNYIDVGQGDSIFIEFPDNETMLIDAGERTSADKVISYIKVLGYSKIDYVVATHPHADHIGGLQKVIETFDIGEIYMPRVTTDTKNFEKLLDAISSKNKKIHTAKANVTIKEKDNLKAIIVAPVNDKYDSLNDYSAVIKITYGDNSFLFTGDAQENSEMEIAANISADVLKVGHHGSSTSSCKYFLNKVNPKYAVISVGEGNDYGHPHDEVINRLKKMGIKILRTDLNGDIVFKSDSENITYSCNKNDDNEPVITDGTETTKENVKYVLNTSTKKIHLPSCSAVEKISPDNYATTDDYDKAINEGYKPCGICKP